MTTKIAKAKELLLNNIQDRMHQLDWKAKDLAEKCDVGVTTIYSILQGTNWIGPEMLEKIAETLEIPISALFSDDDYIHELPTTPKLTSDQALAFLAQVISKSEKPKRKKSLTDFIASLPDDLTDVEINLLFNAVKSIEINRTLRTKSNTLKSKK